MDTDHTHHYVPVRDGTNSQGEPRYVLRCGCGRTPEQDRQEARKLMKAYSPDSGKEYDSWEDLVDAESNELIVSVIVTNSKGRQHTITYGPYATRQDASNAKARARTRLRKETGDAGVGLQFFIQPLWKDRKDL